MNVKLCQIVSTQRLTDLNTANETNCHRSEAESIISNHAPEIWLSYNKQSYKDLMKDKNKIE